MLSESSKRLLSALVLAGAAVIAGTFVVKNAARVVFTPTPSVIEDGAKVNTVPPTPASPDAPKPKAPVSVVTGLRIPWEIERIGPGIFLVTERPGFLREFSVKDGRLGDALRIPNVAAGDGEGGLMGIALHPRWPDEPYLYLYMTTKDGGRLRNRVERYVAGGDGWKEDKTIIDGIPGAKYHDGGTIAFGPDGMLYVTAGDASDATKAQERDSLSGKILRVMPDGGIPKDNPFGTAVWSYGHRNPQGIAWDDKGRMWATEHGRSGAASGYDELNLIVKGGNYGWPLIQGPETREGMISPVAQSGASETWAPAGLAWFDGKLYFGGLRGESLYEATPAADGKSVALKAHFRGVFGRIRAVWAGEGKLLITTSNTDGRGTPRAGDDRIISIDPASLRAAR